MKLITKCFVCGDKQIINAGLKLYIKTKMGLELEICNLCNQALLRIGLVRFSNADIEIENQEKIWKKHRDEILN